MKKNSQKYYYKVVRVELDHKFYSLTYDSREPSWLCLQYVKGRTTRPIHGKILVFKTRAAARCFRHGFLVDSTAIFRVIAKNPKPLKELPMSINETNESAVKEWWEGDCNRVFASEDRNFSTTFTPEGTCQADSVTVVDKL